MWCCSKPRLSWSSLRIFGFDFILPQEHFSIKNRIMGRQSFAHQSILEDVLEWSDENKLIFGFITGQHFREQDYIAHCICSNQYFNYNLQKICEIGEKTFAEHAKELTYMLPGGVWILGIFIITSHNIFNDPGELNKIKLLLRCVENELSINPHLKGKPPSDNFLIYSYDSSVKKYNCNELNASSNTIDINPVNWLFSLHQDSWAVGNYMWNYTKPYSFEISKPKYSELTHMINTFYNRIRNCKWTLNGMKVDPKEKICKYFFTSEKNESHKYFYVNIEMLSDKPSIINEENLASEEFDEFSCYGALTCKIFLHYNSKVEDAIKAVQDDLSRSWASRLELHWRNFEKGIYCTLQPRRVLLHALQSRVYFSHYLFSNENFGDSEMKIHLKRLLGVDTDVCVMIDPHKNKISDDSWIQVKEEIEDSKFVLIVLCLSVLIGGMLYMGFIEK